MSETVKFYAGLALCMVVFVLIVVTDLFGRNEKW